MDPNKFSYPFFMIFDVESIGLHGEGFAVAAMVINREGKEINSFVFACPPERADGEPDDRAWVEENVPSISPTHLNPKDVRNDFWFYWTEWREKGAALVADCGWPVEGRFLARCIDDDPSRKWEGPYPLLDLASLLVAQGIDPLLNRPRLPSELPKHDPLADCRQTDRLFIEALKALG